MTVTLNWPPDVEAQIASEAAQQGMPLPDHLIAVIRERGLRMSEGLEAYLFPAEGQARR